jgi:Spy/CpxP family protein refolding chaperone
MKRIIFFLMVASSLVAAQPQTMDDNPHGGGPGFGRGFMVEKLDLKPDQEKQFESLQSDLQKKQIDLRAKVQTSRIELRDLMNDDVPNKSKIESKMGDISKLQNEMKLNHLNFWFAVNKFLTPEQQKIWKNHPMKFGMEVGAKGDRGIKRGGDSPMRGRGHKGDRFRSPDCQIK